MRLLLISSSNVHGYGYLDQPEPFIRDFLGERRHVVFIPFALADHAGYTKTIEERFGRMGLSVSMLTSARDLANADAIFTGGGNTFRLLSTLYTRELLEPIQRAVRDGLSYIGTSAGTNITAPTIKTTNDMPILEPPSFNALAFVPFQINPHYVDADPTTTHMGETREERLMQYLEENETPVVALREGSLLRVENGTTTLLGEKSARIFKRGIDAYEVEPGVLAI